MSSIQPTTKKITSSARDIIETDRVEQAKQFGARVLEDKSRVYEHNAWDHALWTAENEEQAIKAVKVQQEKKVSEEEAQRLVEDSNEHWNEFYDRNQSNFFKDRHWLGIEFPELFPPIVPISMAHEPFIVMEVGCGAGNTVFPLLREQAKVKAAEQLQLVSGESLNYLHKDLFVFASDFSCSAVQLVKSNPEYDSTRISAFVYDLTSTQLPQGGPDPGTVDVIVLVFVLSAVHPDSWAQAMHNIWQLLRPGGLLVFRDYGRYDLAQLRMKSGRYITNNFYRRGDNTLVYFFTPEEIRNMVTQQGFSVDQLAVDRRLIVNRRKQLQMHRVWLQGKFRKLL